MHARVKYRLRELSPPAERIEPRLVSLGVVDGTLWRVKLRLCLSGLPSMHFSSTTLVELLVRRATDPLPDAYTFLDDGGEPAEAWTYEELADRSLEIAGLLQEAGASGQPILLIFPPGLEYVAAFLGCVCAGAIAVPAYPPDPMRMSRTVPRLAALVADAGARLALTTEPIRSLVCAMGPEASGGLSALNWLATASADAGTRSSWRDPNCRGDDIALLQYTSGSTGTPRGIVLSHENLLHNSAAIHRSFGHGRESRGVIWLPPYHDMGLIGGVLQPLYGGFPVALMSPLAFLARPISWLRAISRYRATTSGGPNFAYDLCVRKTTPEQREELDLSSWDLAFDGAEPIRPDTLDRFTEAFAPRGFRREAFYPCYGLAEATLIASGGRKGHGPVVRPIAVATIERAPAPAADRWMVGCGESLDDQTLRIVDPDRRVELPDGVVGEIWIRGPSVARGVWNDPEATRASFGAKIEGHDESYLRTGDLGLVDRGELFVTGRRKDLMILRGRNIYPQDVEATAAGCDAALRPGGAVAFSIDDGGEERLVLVLECDPRRLGDPSAVLDRVAAEVRVAHDLVANVVALVLSGELPKTSSGKVMRRATRDQFLAGELKEIARIAANPRAAAPERSSTPDDVGSEISRVSLQALPLADRVDVLTRWLGAKLEQCLDGEFERERPVILQGMDSIRAIELSGTVEDALGVSLPMSAILDGATLAVLARSLAEAIDRGAAATHLALEGGADSTLSLEQERLLFLRELAPDRGAYNIAVGVYLDGAFDALVFERAFTTVVERHSVLRSSYPKSQGGWIMRIADPEPVRPRWVECAGDAEALTWAQEEALAPFDLERGPVYRVGIVRIRPDRHLVVLVLHHLVADGWSMGVLVRELGEAYAALADGVSPSLPTLTHQVSDLARAQRARLVAGEFEPSIAYWRETLAGARPLLELPPDRERPASPSYDGASVPVSIGSTDGLRAIARDERATLFMVLVAGFAALVRARTGVEDIVLGTDVAGRGVGRSQSLIGLFVNQVVLRVDTSGNPSFRTLVGRVRRTVLGAFAHDDVPFGTLVAALQPPRDPSYNPIFQLMFVLESAPLPPLALRQLTVQRAPLEDCGAPFDLSVLLAERDGRLDGVFRYRTALYDVDTIGGLVEDYTELLAMAAGDPTAGVDALARALAVSATRRTARRAEAQKATSAERFRQIRRR